MRLRTLLLYLIGNRQAILDIAADRRAVGIGFLFVLSAAFAREYDGEDLLHEPWYLLIPVGASVLASFILFSVAFATCADRAPQGPTFFRAYRSFLALFWMTAPLAWLYAVPYERFLSLGDAVRANYFTLALVALWRVCLMIRVLCVISTYDGLTSVLLVLSFAGVSASIAAFATPITLVDVMGGIRYTESERALRSIFNTIASFACCTTPILVPITMIRLSLIGFPCWKVDAVQGKSSATCGSRLLLLATMSVGVWIIVLPFTQPEQILRYRVERAFAAGQISEALDIMSAHAPSDFPPYWDPPPRNKRSIVARLPLEQVLATVVANPPAAWVREVYLEKADRLFRSGFVDAEQLAASLRQIEQFPEGRTMIDGWQWEILHPQSDERNLYDQQGLYNLTENLKWAREYEKAKERDRGLRKQ